MWAELPAARARTPEVPVLPGREPLDPQPRQHRGLVRDGARLPGPARARRGLAAARVCSDPPACRDRTERLARASARCCVRLVHDPSPAGQAPRRRRRHVRRPSPGGTTCSTTSCRSARTGTGGGSSRGPSRPGPASGCWTSRPGPGPRRCPSPAPGRSASHATSRWACSAPVTAATGLTETGSVSVRRPGDALAAPVRRRAFDAVTISFGLRNMADPEPRWPRCSASPGPAGGWSCASSATCRRPASTCIYGRT